jgi:hypothetical protein
MRDRNRTNCFQGGLGSISGLVVFFDQEVAAEPGEDPVVTRYALLITPNGQSIRKKRARRKDPVFDIEIKPNPTDRTNGQYAPRRRRRDLH